MMLPYVHIRLTVDQMMEGQIGASQQLFHHFLIEITQIEHADLTFHGTHIADHFRRPRLPDGKLVLGGVIFLHHVHKGLYRKRIVLGGDAEFLFVSPALSVPLKESFILAVYFFCVEQKFHTVIGQGDAPAASVEQSDPQLLFQLLHSARKGGLGDIELLRGLVK